MLLLTLCCTEPQGVSEVCSTMDLCVCILASGSRCHNQQVSITWDWGHSPALVQVTLFRRSEDKLFSQPLWVILMCPHAWELPSHTHNTCQCVRSSVREVCPLVRKTQLLVDRFFVRLFLKRLRDPLKFPSFLFSFGTLIIS